MARLPDAYQEVEYLRGTGTQYIRTSYFATGNTSVKIKFRINELQGFGIFGSRDTTTPTNAYLMWGAGAGFWRVQYGNQNFVSDIERDTEWHTWEQRQNVCFLDNKLFYTFDKQTFQNSYEQLLFGIGSGATTITGLYIAKDDIGIVEYWENNELTMQLIPCYRKSDNVAGYYDTVLHEFFTNAGTGTFEVGPDVNKPELRMMYWKGIGSEQLPSEYQAVEYVESAGTTSDTGNTHSIDLGFKGNQDTVINCTVAMMSNPRRVFGDNTTTARAITLYLANSGTEINRFGSNQVTGAIQATLKMGEFQKYTVDKTGIYCDGQQIATYSAVSFTTDGNLRFLTINGYQPNVGVLRVKSFEIVGKVKFVPCKRKIDNAVGFYDFVSGEFKTCAGLTAGSDIQYKPEVRFFYAERNKLPDAYQEVEYIQTQTNSKAYLITDYKQTQNTSLRTVVEGGGWIMGGRTVTPVQDGIGVLFNPSATYAMFGNETNMVARSFTSGKHTVEIGSNGCFIDGEKITDYNPQEFQSQVPMWILNINDKGLPNNAYFEGKIYSAQILENGQIVRNYVPSFRKSDNVIGMYETITNQFLTNAGTGTFTKGSYTSIPSEYQELEYLDTDNQYFASLLNYEACTIEQVVKFEPDTRRRLIGWSTGNTRYWGADASNRYETGPSNVIPADKALATEWHNVKFITDGKLTAPTATVLVDDKFSTTRIGTGGATLSTSYDYVADAYRCVAYFKFIKKILPDGTVKNNLRPCVRKSDNKVGWYDLITAQFLPNNCKAGQYKKTLRIIYM